MLSKKKITAFYILSLLFVAANGLIVYLTESYLFSAIPLVFLFLLFSLFALDKMLILSFALVPLSVPLKEFLPGLDFDMALPTEPLLFLILLIFILKQIRDRDFDKNILKHPVSKVLYFYLGWIAITTITSSMPLVSLKYLMVKLWFIIPFYFLLTQVFKNKPNIYKSFWFYIVPFIIVIIYTLVRHAPHYFDQKSSNFVMTPFFNDHTSYGALLAMYIPIIAGMVLDKTGRKITRIISLGVLGLFVVAIVFSYTRASWVGLIAAMGLFVLLKLKVKIRTLFIGAGIVGTLFILYQGQIMMNLEQNKQDSSTNLQEHVKSISNVATDASNLERINRWNCAIRMFQEKPLFGFGPGTYQFKYAPYQFSYEKTIISTNAGDMGNAHSEYLGPLSESGIFGMLSMLAIVIVFYLTSIRLYYKLKDPKTKTLIVSIICGMTTYFIHGLMNNFLDTDKASAPFWAFFAIVVAIDVYHQEKSPEKAGELL
ncbi:MAG: O-antigen ligase family protein [Bacteroidales bacterium]|nr:O-antigen ligase family protein [Bacteroidales bacterium]